MVWVSPVWYRVMVFAMPRIRGRIATSHLWRYGDRGRSRGQLTRVRGRHVAKATGDLVGRVLMALVQRQEESAA